MANVTEVTSFRRVDDCRAHPSEEQGLENVKHPRPLVFARGNHITHISEHTGVLAQCPVAETVRSQVRRSLKISLLAAQKPNVANR